MGGSQFKSSYGHWNLWSINILSKTSSMSEPYLNTAPVSESFSNKIASLRPETCNLNQKETPTQLFFQEFCKTFKNSYFTEHVRATTCHCSHDWKFEVLFPDYIIISATTWFHASVSINHIFSCSVTEGTSLPKLLEFENISIINQ